MIFSSEDAVDPAKFCVSSAPAHHKYPNIKISVNKIKPVEAGEALILNERKIY